MVFDIIVVGQLQTNCYIAGDENGVMIVDPGDEGRKILSHIDKKGYKPEKIVLTHGHFDHIGAVSFLKEKLGLPVYVHKLDNSMGAPSPILKRLYGISNDSVSGNVFIKDGDVISAGGQKFKVIQTPGHTEGSVCLYSEDILLSGDTLFFETIGNCENYAMLDKMYESLRKLLRLPDSVRVYPGHGRATSIGYERKHNPYVMEAENGDNH